MGRGVQPAAHRAAPALTGAGAASPRRRIKKEAPTPAAPEAQPISLMMVASSSVATLGDKGVVALVLKTEDAGPFAIPLTVEACAVLRCQIAIAQAILNPKRARSDQTRGASAAPTLDPALISGRTSPGGRVEASCD